VPGITCQVSYVGTALYRCTLCSTAYCALHCTLYSTAHCRAHHSTTWRRLHLEAENVLCGAGDPEAPRGRLATSCRAEGGAQPPAFVRGAFVSSWDHPPYTIHHPPSTIRLLMCQCGADITGTSLTSLLTKCIWAPRPPLHMVAAAPVHQTEHLSCQQMQHLHKSDL
jgi:hypothetical protein